MTTYSIDFGTCNSVISYLNDSDNIEYIYEPNTGDILIPSTIYFLSHEIPPNTEILEYQKHYSIGKTATNDFQMYKNTHSYFCQFKRFLGLIDKSNQNELDVLNKFDLLYKLDGQTIFFDIPTMVEGEFIKLSIVDILSLYFKALHEWINSKTLDIFITTPAYFNDRQKMQLKQAFENSNFNVVKFYNEPTSASIYYIYKYYNEIKVGTTQFLIFDVGGGTTDISVIEYDFESRICNVIDVDGDNTLGGCDIDLLLAEHIYNFYNIDKNNQKWKNKILQIAETIKIKLTFCHDYNVILENVPIQTENGIKVVDFLELKYNVFVFYSIIQSVLVRMKNLLVNMKNKYEIADIICIGGTTQIPCVYKMATNIINTKNTDMFLYKTIVSNGSTIMNKIIKNNEDFYIVDIVPMDIFIKTDEYYCVIPKNTKIPTKKKYVLTTQRNAQRSVSIEIYEGENKHFLGNYIIDGIPPVQRGHILIELTFNINNAGLLHIGVFGHTQNSKYNKNIQLTLSYQ